MRKGIFTVTLVVYLVVLVFLWRYAPQQRDFKNSPAMSAVILDDPHVKASDETVPRIPPTLRDITVKPPEQPPSVMPDDMTEGVAPSSSTAITDFSILAHEAAEKSDRPRRFPVLSLARPPDGSRSSDET